MAAFMAAAVAYAIAAHDRLQPNTGSCRSSNRSGPAPFALAAMVGYRFIASDKERRLLQKSFAYYLAPDVIAKMLASNKLPQLGGETREVTVLFSDIEGFSQIAERLSPDALMALTNTYLSAMTDVIESRGGYVDKYIGDSVVAVFGAPIDDDRHAASAARAALGCTQRLAELNRLLAAFPGISGGAAHRHQHRLGAGRQFRVAAALQLLGDERRGEPGLAS